MDNLSPQDSAEAARLESLLSAVSAYRVDVAVRQAKRGYQPPPEIPRTKQGTLRPAAFAPPPMAKVAPPVAPPVERPAPPPARPEPQVARSTPAPTSPGKAVPKPTLMIEPPTVSGTPTPSPSIPAPMQAPSAVRVVQKQATGSEPAVSSSPTSGTGARLSPAVPVFPTPTGTPAIRRPPSQTEPARDTLGSFLRRFRLTAD